MYTNLPSRVAASVTKGTDKHAFDSLKYLDRLHTRTQSPDYILFALAATQEALEDANLVNPIEDYSNKKEVSWKLNTEIAGDLKRIGVAIGCGIGGIYDVEESAQLLYSSIISGSRRLSPFFVPRILANMPAGHVSIRYGLEGPNLAPSTACASGAHAIGDAFRNIKFGMANIMIAGGTEACITPLAMAGFSRARALSTSFNNTPEVASRPFDKKRDGFVLGEGAGILILEEFEHAKARNANIYAEIRGFGTASDSYHVTTPPTNGAGALRCMQVALEEAGLDKEYVDYVNAHATSTTQGDLAEAAALNSLFDGRKNRNKVFVSSTKGAIGHLLGAAGAVEAVFCSLAIKKGEVPLTTNLHEIDPSINQDTCDYLQHSKFDTNIKVTLSNSFGFGGTNASLCITKCE
jgi:3-oxoacyl-[acyl-carrier-protein] synthase II